MFFFRHSELFKPNGRFIKEGDFIKRTKYGNTLKKIAKSGSADIFYTGKMAEQVLKRLRGFQSKYSNHIHEWEDSFISFCS